MILLVGSALFCWVAQVFLQGGVVVLVRVAVAGLAEFMELEA